MSITSEIDELGRSWLVVDDELWEQAVFTEYKFGMPFLSGVHYKPGRR